MAQSILIISESGAGKSTAIRNLKPEETFIINVANKPLPFKGWKGMYPIWSRETQDGRMYTRSTAHEILACMKYVSEKRPDIKTLVIDDLQYMSAFEYFEKAEEKGYEKFTKIAKDLTTVARAPKDMREDLQVYFMTHAEETLDAYGVKKVKAKTIGRMIDNSLTFEGLFSIVLFGKVKRNQDDSMRYVFETVNDGTNTCKAPAGMFDDPEIPNDLEFVRQAIINYEN
jgi:hypothetical protein